MTTRPAEPEPLIRTVIHDALGTALAPYLADPRQRHGLTDHLTRRLLDALAADGLHITRRPTREDTR